MAGTSEQEPKKVLAVCSGGGHWVQLKRILPALADQRLRIATVHASAKGEVQCERFYVIKDASLWSKFALIHSALGIAWLLLRVRPDVVISTGAAPGYFALFFGKLLGARTIWIDSIANAEQLSLSGQKAGRLADLWLTQWEHLARPDGPHFRGSVL